MDMTFISKKRGVLILILYELYGGCDHRHLRIIANDFITDRLENIYELLAANLEWCVV